MEAIGRKFLSAAMAASFLGRPMRSRAPTARELRGTPETQRRIETAQAKRARRLTRNLAQLEEIR